MIIDLRIDIIQLLNPNVAFSNLSYEYLSLSLSTIVWYIVQVNVGEITRREATEP